MSSPMSESALTEIRSLIQQGKLIPAVKAYREATACGLAEAKDAVEQLWARMHHEEPGKDSPRPEPQSVGKVWTLLAAAAIFLAIYATITQYILPRVANGERVSPNAAVELRPLSDEPFEGSNQMSLPDGSQVHVGSVVRFSAPDFASFKALRAASASPQLQFKLTLSGIEKIVSGVKSSSAAQSLSLGVLVRGRLVSRVSHSDFTNDGLVISFPGLSESDVNEIYARFTE